MYTTKKNVNERTKIGCAKNILDFKVKRMNVCRGSTINN